MNVSVLPRILLLAAPLLAAPAARAESSPAPVVAESSPAPAPVVAALSADLEERSGGVTVTVWETGVDSVTVLTPAEAP